MVWQGARHMSRIVVRDLEFTTKVAAEQDLKLKFFKRS